MDDTKDSVMISLLPITTSWCRIDLPHLTLVYAGLMTDLKPSDYNELAKDACSIAMLASTITLRVLGIEVFGDVDKVDVLRLQPSSELMAMRRPLESWNKSEFPFNPHVTIGPTGQPNDIPPLALAFNRIMVSWGEDNLTFWLKGSGFNSGGG